MGEIVGWVDEDLSGAIVLWSGFGVSSAPSRNEFAVVATFGEDTALDLLPRVKECEDSFYLSGARFSAPDLISMGEQAAAEFRGIHPEISQEAVRALTWCYTYDYK